MEVKHYYQINNVDKGTKGKRIEVGSRSFNINLEKDIEPFSEMVFTTDISEEVQINDDYRLLLMKTHAFVHSHEYDDGEMAEDWNYNRSVEFVIKDIDSELDWAYEKLGNWALTNSKNLPLFMANSSVYDGSEMPGSEELGLKYKNVYLLDNEDKILSQTNLEKKFDSDDLSGKNLVKKFNGVGYSGILLFANELIEKYFSMEVPNFDEALKSIFDTTPLSIVEKAFYEELARLIKMVLMKKGSAGSEKQCSFADIPNSGFSGGSPLL